MEAFSGRGRTGLFSGRRGLTGSEKRSAVCLRGVNGEANSIRITHREGILGYLDRSAPNMPCSGCNCGRPDRQRRFRRNFCWMTEAKFPKKDEIPLVVQTMTTAAEVKLLTLLNVTAVKRPHTIDAPGGHRGSPQLKAVAELGGLNGSPKGHAGVKRRKSVTFAGVVGPSGTQSGKAKKGRLDEVVQTNGHTQGSASWRRTGTVLVMRRGLVGRRVPRQILTADSVDIFNVHFGSEPPLLQLVKDQGDTEWTATRTTLSGYGKATLLEATADEARPQASSSRVSLVCDLMLTSQIVPSLLSSVKAGKQPVLLSSALAQVGSYRDLYLHSLDSEAEGREIELYGPEKEAMRRAIAVHSINHILKWVACQV